MFPLRYWANRFFNPRYWAPVGANPADDNSWVNTRVVFKSIETQGKFSSIEVTGKIK